MAAWSEVSQLHSIANGQQERQRQRSFGRRQEDHILDCAIYYILNKTYPCELENDKKRAVRKRAATLVLEDGEVFVQQKNRKVKVIGSREDQLLSVQTWRRLTDFALYEWYYCALLQIYCESLLLYVLTRYIL